MRPSQNSSRTSFIIITAIISWIAVLLQFYLLLTIAAARGKPAARSVMEFFGYYTILTNILVAFSQTVLWWLPGSPAGLFFSKPKTSTAITLYITVVGLVYNIILRSLWHPTGLSMVADELLHSVIPLLLIIYWWFFVPKGLLLWKDVFYWLVYPAVYLVYAMVLGALSGFYPYPFINVSEIGYNGAFTSAGILFIVFLGLGLLFIALDKWLFSRQITHAEKIL